MDLPTQTPERLTAVSPLLYVHICCQQWSTQITFFVRPGVGMCTGTCGKNGWLCQHRWTAISGMTGFRNAVDGAPITNWVSPQSNRIAFGRGKCLSLRSYLAILTGHLRFGWLRRHQQWWLGMERYFYYITRGWLILRCDQWNQFFHVLHRDFVSFTAARYSFFVIRNSCSISVSAGSLTAIVPSRSAIAIHTLATGTEQEGSSVSVTFSEIAVTTFGEVHKIPLISTILTWPFSRVIEYLSHWWHTPTRIMGTWFCGMSNLRVCSIGWHSDSSFVARLHYLQLAIRTGW